ncbi:hypothetical protein R5R35_014662 [Gryllus longicercus]|uniref:Piwi n=1 Tax=Gryllus longicercus TaxID=2509291 RepID=A0AAN9VDI4_9ORTH
MSDPPRARGGQEGPREGARGRRRGRAGRGLQQPRQPGASAAGPSRELDAEALGRRLQGAPLAEPPPGADAGASGVGRANLRGRRVAQEPFLRTRPDHVTSKQGASGARIKLSANYFRLETHTDWRLYQYRVDFDPETDQTVVKKGLLRVHRESLGGYIFDGTVLFTSRLLSEDRAQVIELSSKRADDVNIRITIRLVGDLALGDYHYLQFFNILMRKCLQHLKLQLVGRNYFDPKARINVNEYRMELWPGYVTSIRQHESSILMCAEITHKIMRNDTVLNILTDAINAHGAQGYRRSFQQNIIGAVVLTDYNNRTYRVDDVDFDTSPISTFKLRSGAEISYKNYYKQKYQIRITQDNQPLLVSRTKARELRAGQSPLVYLVPELCRMTGLTDEMRNNFQLMRALAEHTRVGPRSRVDKLLKFGQRLTQEKAIAEDFREWNMRFSQRLLEFDARVMQNEPIIQSSSEKYNPSALVDWTRDLRSRPMLVMPDFNVWAVIVPGKMKSSAMSFISTLQKAGGGMRFRIPGPQCFDIKDDRASTYVEAIERAINTTNPQLIMIIVPNNRADRYSSLKKKCCVDRAVPSQVVLGKNLNAKGVMSIATKVSIQICCKIGGAPWTVDMPLSGLMVAGFDVCHDTTTRGRSFGAMVASLDKSMTRYYSAASAHTTGEELSNDLSLNMTKAARRYMDYNNGALPARIIIYRDGVGEGQIPYVFQHEVNLVRETLGKLYASAGVTLKLAYIIVNKRINTRLFLNNDNPPPGTVVDDCITLPERYDFFLVSQTVRQGTVSPTYYNVISDNVGLDPDKMQRLSYKLTHMYYNWSGTVRVPAPCQYAHKLAYLVGQALHRSPNNSLEDYLYYL